MDGDAAPRTTRQNECVPTDCIVVTPRNHRDISWMPRSAPGTTSARRLRKKRRRPTLTDSRDDSRKRREGPPKPQSRSPDPEHRSRNQAPHESVDQPPSRLRVDGREVDPALAEPQPSGRDPGSQANLYRERTHRGSRDASPRPHVGSTQLVHISRHHRASRSGCPLLDR